VQGWVKFGIQWRKTETIALVVPALATDEYTYEYSCLRMDNDEFG